MNRHDLEGFLAGWAEEATFIFPGDVAASGTWQGKPAIREWFERFFDQFPGINFSVKHVAVNNLFDVVGNNVVAIHWDVELRNKAGYQNQNSGVTVITLKRGKVVHARDYIHNTGEAFKIGWGEKQEEAAS